MLRLIVNEMLETDAVANTLIGFVARQVDEAVTKYVDEIRDGDKTTLLSMQDDYEHVDPPKTRKPKSQKKKINVENTSSHSDDTDWAKWGVDTDLGEYSGIPIPNPKQGAHEEKGLRPLRSVNTLFTEALDYRTYRLRKTSIRYDNAVPRKISKWAKMVEVQMKNRLFSAADPSPSSRF